MKKEEALERLYRQISQIDEIKTKPSFSAEFKKWHRDTEVIIEIIFGEGTRHLEDFKEIDYSLMIFTDVTPDYEFQNRFAEGLENARSILMSFIQEVEEFWEENSSESSSTTPKELIKLLCERFHLVSRQIRSRHNDRETLNIEDEYDVQDLFHALLTLYFDDIREEEWTPSYAGSCSRVDFLLKQDELVIEIKKTRKGLNAKDIGEQLIIDIQRYQAHPSCKTLICFVYDPEARISNPRGIENDLNRDINGFEVKVYITPRGI